MSNAPSAIFAVFTVLIVSAVPATAIPALDILECPELIIHIRKFLCCLTMGFACLGEGALQGGTD